MIDPAALLSTISRLELLLAAAEEERDALREENRVLREALQSPPGAPDIP